MSDDTTDLQAPAEGDETPPIDFAAWIVTQPADVQQGWQDHVKGLKSALDSERDRAKRLEAEQKARAKAEDEAEKARLAEQQKWQELAERVQGEKAALEKRVAELAPATEKVTRLEEALSGYLQAERKGLPAHILALLDKLDVVAQLEYIASNRDALRPPQTPGIPATPAPGTPSGKLSDEERRKRAWQPRL